MNIQELSSSERILLAQQLWDSVIDHADKMELTERQQQVIEQRLRALEEDGDLGDSWQTVKDRIVKG